jgi:hypothetical protein
MKKIMSYGLLAGLALSLTGFSSISDDKIIETTNEESIELVERSCDDEAEIAYYIGYLLTDSEETATNVYFIAYWECIDSGEGESEYTVEL